MLGKPGLQWLQPPHGATDPVGERRTIQLGPLPAKDLALPVEWQVIAVFGDQGRITPWLEAVPRGPETAKVWATFLKRIEVQ